MITSPHLLHRNVSVWASLWKMRVSLGGGYQILVPYWSTSTKAWDIAAGALMVLEAGGAISHYAGGPLDLARPQFVAAATLKLHNELRGLLHRTG